MARLVKILFTREPVAAVVTKGSSCKATLCTKGLPPGAVLAGAGVNSDGNLESSIRKNER